MIARTLRRAAWTLILFADRLERRSSYSAAVEDLRRQRLRDGPLDTRNVDRALRRVK